MARTKQIGRFGAFGLSVRLAGEFQALEALANQLQGLFMGGDYDVAEAAVLVSEVRARVDEAVAQLDRLGARVGCATDADTPRLDPDAVAAPAGFRGSCRAIAVADLLGLLSTQRKTGTLRIQSGALRFVLEFQDGAVVHAATNSPKPERRIGTILVAQQSLSATALEDFLREHTPDCGPLGAALARASLVEEQDLIDALGIQVHDLIRQVLELDDGSFHFEVGPVQDLEFRVSLNTMQLLLDAARVRDESRV